MSKLTFAELAALLAQQKQSTERANASLDATLRHLDESEARLPERDKAARARALAEFDSLDFAAIADALNFFCAYEPKLER